MTYAEATTFLFNSLPVWEQKGANAYKPGLERVRAFARAVGDPQENIKTIHVAGTNGKGSTSHLLAAVLQSAGYRTGLFTSPHLVDFRERIRVNGTMIPEEAVVEFTERWHGEMVRTGLTFFEMATVMALWWFSRSGCDLAVIEAGLGGRLDSTNIITPILSIITNIGLEHTQYLGDTIAAIAAEKAGIIKPSVPVVIGEYDPESAPVFTAKAAATGSPIVFADKSQRREEKLPSVLTDGQPENLSSGRVLSQPFLLDLQGDYQQKNLRTVLAAVDILRRNFDIPDEALRRGLQNAAALTGLQGRWQVVAGAPLTVLDTAHNAHGIAEAAKQIARQRYDKLFMVLGFAGDKDLASILPLLPKNAHYILTQAAGARAMPAETLHQKFADNGFSETETETETKAEVETDTGTGTEAETDTGTEVESETYTGTKTDTGTTVEIQTSVAAAIRRANRLASPRDMIYIGGSNFVVGEALATLENR